MASYLVLGAAGTLAYLRRGSVRAETALPAAGVRRRQDRALARARDPAAHRRHRPAAHRPRDGGGGLKITSSRARSRPYAARRPAYGRRFLVEIDAAVRSRPVPG